MKDRAHFTEHRRLSAAPPIDWGAILTGQQAPRINFEFSTDQATKKTLYTTAAIIGAAIFVGAFIARGRR